MDLIDEQHVVRLEVGEQGSEVAGTLQHRARRMAQVDTELVGDDMGERRLAESRRAEQQHVIERLFALFRGLDEDRELAANFFLSDVLVKRAWPQRSVEHFFLWVHRRGGD